MTRRRHAKLREQADLMAEQLATREDHANSPWAAFGRDMAADIVQSGSGDGFLRKMMGAITPATVPPVVIQS